MTVLLLSYRGEPLREFGLNDRPLEVGRSRFCDIVIHDSSVADRELLIVPSGGSVYVHRLAGGQVGPACVFPYNEPISVGDQHSLVRLPQVDPAGPRDGHETDALGGDRAEQHGFSLVVGRGAGARSIALGVHPITVGSAPDNDLVLTDRSVSAHHCRVEPCRDRLMIRDLDSLNGTWVHGHRIALGWVFAGSVLRLGRTDLWVVTRDDGKIQPTTEFVAVSEEMVRVMSEVRRYAVIPWPVLVTGESGTGKEGVAQALHEQSSRCRGPFVALNAGGLSRELVESELFGHERGAFTGATQARKGAFERAHKGTLFMDEIGELPLSMQTRLLRVLESWCVRRVGGDVEHPVDVRLICATNRDLKQEVSRGNFRSDLYYRVHRLGISVPPLRNRLADVEPLAQHFLNHAENETGGRVLSTGALDVLIGHHWPGNVRELRNVVCAAAANTSSRTVHAQDIERAIQQLSGFVRPELSDERLFRVLEHHGGNRSAAARALGIPRSTLRDRIKKAAEKTSEEDP